MGISAARRVPRPTGLDFERPSQRLEPVDETPEARSMSRLGAAVAIVFDCEADPAVAGRHGNRDPRCAGVLRDVRG
jgi:hypothetical protein